MPFVLVAIIQSLLLSAVFSQKNICKETFNVEFTFYGMADGGDITAFSCGNNRGIAGGTGSYSSPETFATSKNNPSFTRCEIVYIPYLRKYFQYSDLCIQCDEDYIANTTVHLDLWIGVNTNGGSA